MDTIICVGGIVRCEDKYLLLRLSKESLYCRGDWDFVWGYPVLHRIGEQAALYFLKKNMGFDGELVEKFEPYTWLDDESRVRWIFVSYLFSLRSPNVTLGKKYSEYVWVHEDEILKYDRLEYLQFHLERTIWREKKKWVKPYFNTIAYIIGDNSIEGYGYLKQPEDLLARTCKEVHGIINLANLNPSPTLEHIFRILDVGCGYGRHANALAHCGYQMVGIDLSELLIRVARYRAARNLNVWEKQEYSIKKIPVFFINDIRETLGESIGQFNVAVSISSALDAYTWQEKVRILKKIRAILRPGGCLIYQPIYIYERLMSSKYLLETSRRTRMTTIMGTMYPPGVLHYRKEFNRATQTLTAMWRVELEGRLIPSVPVQAILSVYSVEEHTAMLYEAGFSHVECFGSWDALPYQPGDEEIIFRASA